MMQPDIDLESAPVPEVDLSDSEIDAIIREVAGAPDRRAQPFGNDGRAPFLYLIAFLLGMTAMEGLRLLAPPEQELRGIMEQRCDAVRTPAVPTQPGALY